MNELVTPNICHIKVGFRDDKTLELPEIIETMDTSNVRFITMKDVARVLERYEALLRVELQEPSEMDRFVAIPEGQCHRHGRNHCSAESMKYSWTL